MDEMQTASTPERKRLTPIDVQQKVFRRATFRGYHEQDVDDFLDEMTEELALLLDEVRQLRERAGMPAGAAGDTSEALRSADDIVRQAREEAAEILRRARTEASSAAAPPAPAAAPAGAPASALHPFLSQERTFLQELSQLIQRHADTVRDMARTRRPAPAANADTRTVEVGEVEPAAEDRV